MRGFELLGGMVVGVVAVVGGCQLIAGVEDPVPYPPDGGTGSGGRDGGGTTCEAGAMIACAYSGPAGTQDVGICRAGMQKCSAEGIGDGVCSGEVIPQAESCASTEDENCDGYDCVQWAELFGDGADQFVSGIATDSSGNIYITGSFAGSIAFGTKNLISSGGTDIFLLKLNPNGKPIWSEQFGDGAYQDGSLIAVDPSDNIYVTGRSATPIDLGGAQAPAGLFVAKLTSEGKRIWSKGLTTKTGCGGSDSNIFGLATTPQGDVVFGGYYCGTIDFGEGAIASKSGSRDGFVAKLKSNDGSIKAADQTWGIVFGDAQSQELNGLAVDTAGNVLIVGTFNGSINLSPSDFFSSSGGSDAFVAKLTAAGLPSWHVVLGDGLDQSMRAIAVDFMGGPIVTGSFDGTIDFNGTKVTKGTSFIAKYDSDGGYKWHKIITTTAAATSVSIDGTGNAILAGAFVGSLDLAEPSLKAAGQGVETFTAKLSATGTLLWNKRFGDDLSGLGAGAYVAVTSAGEPILAGRVAGPIDFGTGVLTPAGGVDIFLTKLSP